MFHLWNVAKVVSCNDSISSRGQNEELRDHMHSASLLLLLDPLQLADDERDGVVHNYHRGNKQSNRRDGNVHVV